MSKVKSATNIPFSLPYVGKEEQEAVASAVLQDPLHGDGPISRRVEKWMEEWLGVKHVYLTTSCTHALEMAMLVLEIGPDDEVIMPSFNFVSSANAVSLRGATPVFADIKPETMNIDPSDVINKITSKTKAIIPVHYAGVSCDMDEIMEIARMNNLFVVEDAAQGVDAYYKSRPLGTMGDIGCYSFHDTKNITCGEGGAFITNNDDIARKAEIIREKGTNRSAFLRGEIDKYSWVGLGSSYILSDILSAILEVQLNKRKEIFDKRKIIWNKYYKILKPFEKKNIIRLPFIPDDRKSNYHIFYFNASSNMEQDLIINALKSKGIQATFHYVPLHSAPYLSIAEPNETYLQNTNRYSNTIIRLPLYPSIYSEIDGIVNTISDVMSNLFL